jgi:hypothetical protein
MLDDVLLVSRMRFTCSRLGSTQLMQDLDLVGQCGMSRDFKQSGRGPSGCAGGSTVFIQQPIPFLALHARVIPTTTVALLLAGVALGRILGGRQALKHYEVGMDLGLSRNMEESFRIFQSRIVAQYEAMIEEMDFHVIDATKSIEAQQKEMRRIFLRECGGKQPPSVLGTEAARAGSQA